MDQLLAAFASYAPLTIAGGFGGAIRWWSMQSSWRQGIGHVLAGMIAGTYLGGLVFRALQPLIDLSGMDPQDARLLGAHFAGAVGLNIYTVPVDFLRQWGRAVKASTDKEQDR